MDFSVIFFSFLLSCYLLVNMLVFLEAGFSRNKISPSKNFYKIFVSEISLAGCFRTKNNKVQPKPQPVTWLNPWDLS